MLLGVPALAILAAAAWANAPARYKAHLDPPGLELTEFHSGQLMGWYVYVWIDGKRIVCANPRVWDGPKVVTCNYIVAIETEGEKP
jgi:hypothetical protein